MGNLTSFNINGIDKATENIKHASEKVSGDINESVQHVSDDISNIVQVAIVGGLALGIVAYMESEYTPLDIARYGISEGKDLAKNISEDSKEGTKYVMDSVGGFKEAAKAIV